MPSLSMPSPIGQLTIEEEDREIVAIRWGDGLPSNGSPLLAEAARQLDAYFAGRVTDFDLPLSPAGSGFEQRVWAAMQTIPYGQTRCYGDLAEAVGSAPRAVGRACGTAGAPARPTTRPRSTITPICAAPRWHCTKRLSRKRISCKRAIGSTCSTGITRTRTAAVISSRPTTRRI